MSDSLAGRHALVCGGSAGIGRAAAISLAARGARLTALARSEERLQALCSELEAAGATKPAYVVADLEDRPRLRGLTQALLEARGSVDVLVNNSGGPPGGPLLEAEEDDFLQPFGRHLLASHQLVKACLPGMIERGYGRIINVISISVKEPIVGLGVSNTIRGAMAAWAKTLAKELPPEVTINNVLPGFTDTARLAELKESNAAKRGVSADEVEEGWLSLVPEGRLARPAELGEVVAFLASPAASFVRGVSLPVDGGRLSGI